MTNEVTDRHPAQALRRCATTPEESLSAPGEREDVRSADTLSVNPGPRPGHTDDTDKKKKARQSDELCFLVASMKQHLQT